MSVRNQKSVWSRLLIAGISLGIVIRALLAIFTKGTNDISAWEAFASTIIAADLGEVYRSFNGVPGRLLMNHPPFAGIFSSECLYISRALGIPFWIVFKIFQALSDFCTVVLLGRIAWNQTKSTQAALLAMVIYSLSPVSILISGYHGNTDALCVLGIVASVLALQGQRWFWAGCALAFAINIKVIPLLFVPFFLLAGKGLRSHVSFLLGIALGLLPMALFILGNPQSFTNIFGYQSNVEPWGVRALAMTLMPPQFASDAIVRGLSLFAFLSLLGLCGWRAFKDSAWLTPAKALFLPAAAFVLLAPGFGVQYCIYPLAGAIVCAPRQALLWSLITGAFLLSVYSKWIVSWHPLAALHTGPFAFYDSVVLGLLSWGVLGVLIATVLRNQELLSCSRSAVGVAGVRK